jgi:hypothetical protein
MAFIDPEFYQGSPLQEETEARAARDEVIVPVPEVGGDDEFIVPVPDVNLGGPETVMPSDQEEDAYGQMKYLQDENGAWYNNSEFYEMPIVPSDFGTEDSLGNPKYLMDVDARGNQIYIDNPAYNSGRKPDTKPGTTPGTGTDAAGTATGKEDAFAVVDDLVRSYGLDQSVADFIKGEMKIGQSRTAIAMKIRDLPAYNLRFPAMKARIDAGLPALTENEYMALETDYRSAMQAADLPANFSDSPDDFAALIEGDVSVAELQSRVALAEQALDTANQDTIAQLQNFYDLPKGSLTAYFLDPQRAKNVFEQNRRMEAAGLSAGAMRAVGPSQGLKRGTAERLQREGVAQSQLVQRLSARRGLAEATLGAEAVTADELALGEFGITPESVSRVRRETEQRASRFAGQAGTLMDRAGFTGLGEAN